MLGEGTPLNGRVWRYNNTLDTVPYGWDDVTATRDFYQPAPRGGLLIEALVTAMALRLKTYGYTAVGTEIKLAGQLRQQDIPWEFVGYLLENLHQHLPDTYLALLGAPCLPFAIGLGAIVLARDDPRAARLGENRMPICFS